MGQKTHPVGFRLAVTHNWQSRWFANKKEFPALLLEDQIIRSRLMDKLKQASVPRIFIERASNRVRVKIFTAQTARPTMEVQALTRNTRMSPKKVREVARQIQGRKVTAAVDLLTLIPRKSARLLLKTLKSAIANAENNPKVNLTADQLTVHRALVENGSSLRRFKAGPRGTAMPRVKKMSHIRIVLSDEAKQN